MTPRTAALLTRLYSPSWRTRYGAEFEALLQDVALTPAVVADVVFMALITRRRSLALFCFVAFIAVSLTVAIRQSYIPHTVAVKPKVRIVAYCREYSSLSPTQFSAKRRCLT
jgi:hypothetical protein